MTHKQTCNLTQTVLGLVNDDEQIVVHSVVSMHGHYTAVHVFVPRGQQHIHYAAAECPVISTGGLKHMHRPELMQKEAY